MATRRTFIKYSLATAGVIAHCKGNFAVGNDRGFMIKVISHCLPYIGYPRSLNALRCVNDAARS